MVQALCSPLEYDGQRMPTDSFHNLWHTPGFKYEYGHGRVNISIQRSAAPIVVARPSMIIESISETSSFPDDVVLERANEASVEELMGLWNDTFVRTPDYYGYSVEDIRKEASETLNPLYHGDLPELHASSVVARWRENPVGMLLINQGRARPLIEALGVRPDLQHRGVASAMVKEAATSLQGEGEHVLCSGYLLANAKSAAWHEAVGFVEIPDWLTTHHRFRCAQHNLKRGLVRDVIGMKRYVDTLRSEVKQMSQDRDEDPSAHCPFRWIKSDGDRIDEYLSDHVKEHDTHRVASY